MYTLVLTFTDPWVPDIFEWIFVVEGFTHLTVASHCVMLTVVTHTSTDISRGQVDGHIKVTLG